MVAYFPGLILVVVLTLAGIAWHWRLHPALPFDDAYVRWIVIFLAAAGLSGAIVVSALAFVGASMVMDNQAAADAVRPYLPTSLSLGALAALAFCGAVVLGIAALAGYIRAIQAPRPEPVRT